MEKAREGDKQGRENERKREGVREVWGMTGK